ncbi:hypothetical protein Gorai_021507, partial [Gossypium raimondii]|nr:hypothetical protein [Gossypium raimondii]
MKDELAGLNIEDGEEKDALSLPIDLGVQKSAYEHCLAGCFLTGSPWTFNNHLLIIHCLEKDEEPLQDLSLKAQSRGASIVNSVWLCEEGGDASNERFNSEGHPNHDTGNQFSTYGGLGRNSMEHDFEEDQIVGRPTRHNKNRMLECPLIGEYTGYLKALVYVEGGLRLAWNGDELINIHSFS